MHSSATFLHEQEQVCNVISLIKENKSYSIEYRVQSRGKNLKHTVKQCSLLRYSWTSNWTSRNAGVRVQCSPPTKRPNYVSGFRDDKAFSQLKQKRINCMYCKIKHLQKLTGPKSLLSMECFTQSPSTQQWPFGTQTISSLSVLKISNTLKKQDCVKTMSTEHIHFRLRWLV